MYFLVAELDIFPMMLTLLTYILALFPLPVYNSPHPFERREKKIKIFLFLFSCHEIIFVPSRDVGEEVPTTLFCPILGAEGIQETGEPMRVDHLFLLYNSFSDEQKWYCISLSLASRQGVG